MSGSTAKQTRFRACIYTGDLRRGLRGCTGHARPAGPSDDKDVLGLWAFQIGGEGELHWVREADLSFLKRRKVAR